MQAIYIISGIIGYCCITGALCGYFHAAHNDAFDDNPGLFFTALCWPVAIPILISVILSRSITLKIVERKKFRVAEQEKQARELKRIEEELDEEMEESFNSKRSA